MISYLMEMGHQIIIAFAQLFDAMQLSLSELMQSTALNWLADVINWLNDFISKLPDFLTLFADELLDYAFNTPLVELILLSPVVYIIYQFIIWLLNIIT